MKTVNVIKDIIDNEKIGNSEKVLYLKMLFKYGPRPFKANFAFLADAFNMNINTVSKQLAELRLAGLIDAEPEYGKGGGRCGTIFRLKG